VFSGATKYRSSTSHIINQLHQVGLNVFSLPRKPWPLCLQRGGQRDRVPLRAACAGLGGANCSYNTIRLLCKCSHPVLSSHRQSMHCLSRSESPRICISNVRHDHRQSVQFRDVSLCLHGKTIAVHLSTYGDSRTALATANSRADLTLP